MNNECFIDISLKLLGNTKYLKLDQTASEFQITLNLGSLIDIQIQDENILCLTYKFGYARLDLDETVINHFLLTKSENK